MVRRQVFDHVREHLGEDIGSANIVISGTSTVLSAWQTS